MKILLVLLLTINCFAGKIQRQGVKTEAELIAAGSTKADLIRDTQIYVTALSLNKRLDEAITAGNFTAGANTTTVTTTTTFVVPAGITRLDIIAVGQGGGGAGAGGGGTASGHNAGGGGGGGAGGEPVYLT